MAEERKTAADILISRFLKDVEKKGTMPWQRPYEQYNAFNWVSMKPYRGFNRLFLPFGEYLTANQINTYNKEHNEDFRFQKGIEWYPIYFFKLDTKPCSFEEVSEKFPDMDVNSIEGYIGTKSPWSYYHENDSYTKTRQILRYSEVADRHWFKNSKGEMLPSRLETGEVEITLSEPKKVIDDYVKRSGVKVNKLSGNIPCYIPLVDTVELNPYQKSEKTWFSTAFHEFAHSTGAKHRLNRVGITYKGIDKKDEKAKKSTYAVEECIAEITAYLCCAECGVYDFETSGMAEYENNIAYVQGWKKRVQDFGKEFLYICSQADMAFNYILGEEV